SIMKLKHFTEMKMGLNSYIISLISSSGSHTTFRGIFSFGIAQEGINFDMICINNFQSLLKFYIILTFQQYLHYGTINL
ncbi:MAG: hypothetical protein K8R25_13695, partial [Methanosarcinales archaeon]|nr:hypothetical protein [Methanosarcinales archaeon]